MIGVPDGSACRMKSVSSSGFARAQMQVRVAEPDVDLHRDARASIPAQSSEAQQRGVGEPRGLHPRTIPTPPSRPRRARAGRVDVEPVPVGHDALRPHGAGLDPRAQPFDERAANRAGVDAGRRDLLGQPLQPDDLARRARRRRPPSPPGRAGRRSRSPCPPGTRDTPDGSRSRRFTSCRTPARPAREVAAPASACGSRPSTGAHHRRMAKPDLRVERRRPRAPARGPTR